MPEVAVATLKQAAPVAYYALKIGLLVGLPAALLLLAVA